jgi:uncharacterized membrane protein YkvA (DUF1232 family)
LRKLLSLRHWSHVVRRVFKLLLHPAVSWKDKCWFAVPVVVYWIAPDVLPMLPVDDIAVTMLVANWFAERMENKYPQIP